MAHRRQLESTRDVTMARSPARSSQLAAEERDRSLHTTSCVQTTTYLSFRVHYSLFMLIYSYCVACSSFYRTMTDYFVYNFWLLFLYGYFLVENIGLWKIDRLRMSG